MPLATAFVPEDRRRALAAGQPLPDRAHGAALFADISGFTPLTEALARDLGPRRGAETLTLHLNRVYTALISQVQRWGGSVIGFSGDAITCWFDDHTLPHSGSLNAIGAALWMQDAMHAFADLALPGPNTAPAGSPAPAGSTRGRSGLRLKVAVVAGPAQRLVVGDPAVQAIDVLAGATLDALADAEHAAQQQEVVADRAAVSALAGETLASETLAGDALAAYGLRDLPAVRAWRKTAAGQEVAVLELAGPLYDPVGPQQVWGAPAVAFDPSVDAHIDEAVARRWVLPDVYDRLRTEEGRFLAELRPATALFLHFGGLDFDADPHAPQALDAFIRWVQGVLGRYAGSLIQLTTGDKGAYLYAAFGAPVSHDDDAERAVAAALELVHPPPGLSVTGLAAGLADGLMRVGPYGSELRLTYGVLGDATNFAARLMAQAEPGQVCLAAGIAAAVGDRFELQPLGLRTFKGKREPQPVFAVLGRPAGRSGAAGGLLAAAGAAPLVGRAAELAQAVGWVQAALAGNGLPGSGLVCCLEGEAGAGKSHLTAHLLAAAQSLGVRCLVAACQSTTQTTAWYAARQLLRGLLGLDDSPDPAGQVQRPEAAVQRLEAAVQRLDPAWLLRLPLLGDVLGLPIPDNPTTAAFDAGLRREALAALVVDLVRRAGTGGGLGAGHGDGHARPLLLVVEDAHWLDESSRLLVLALARVLGSAPGAGSEPATGGEPLLLLLVQRPTSPEPGSPAHELAELAAGHRLVLGELDAAGTAALVATRLGGPPDSLTAAFVHSLAQGNPFFCEELVDALREGGLLVRGSQGAGAVSAGTAGAEATAQPGTAQPGTAQPGGPSAAAPWQLAPSLIDALRRAACIERISDRTGERWQLTPGAALASVDIGVPASIHGLVLSRLDRLPEAVTLTLKVAGVIGRVFELRLLAAAHPSHPDPATLAAQFALLEARDFARLESPDPEPVYQFKHNLTQEVVYQTLLESQRQELHLAVAGALEARDPEAVERLALHYGQADLSRSGVRQRLIRCVDASAWRSHRRQANETALAWFDRALQLELRWEWLRGRAEVLHVLGRRLHEEATLLALAETPDAGTITHEFAAALLWAQFYGETGEYAAAAQSLAQAHALALAEGDRRGEARCLARQALIAWRQGDYAVAQERYSAALTLIRQAQGERDPELVEIAAEAQYGLGLVARQQSRYDDAARHFQAALAIDERIGDLQHEARTRNALGSVANLKRDFRRAIDLFEQALHLRERIGDRAGVGTSLMSLAQSYGYLGDYSRVEPLLVQALEIQQAVRNRWEEMLVRNELGILYMTVGQYDRALAMLEQALAVSAAIDSEIGAAYILCNLGQAQRDAGDQAGAHAAVATLTRGLALPATQEDVSLQAIYLADLALAHLRLGDPAAAATAARQALAFYGQTDQPLAATGAQAALAQALLAGGDPAGAATAVADLLRVLDACGGDGPDFPQRDYWLAAQVLQVLGDSRAAAHAAARAGELLAARAQAISDPDLRRAYLTQVAIHAEIEKKMQF